MIDAPTNTSLASRWTDSLPGQALVFQLLGKVFYEPPTPAWLQALADEAVFDEVPFGGHQPEVIHGLELLQQWQRAFRDAEPSATAEAVRADYTRLFVGPGKLLAPPWESAQMDEERLLFQEETLAVRAFYRRYGLELLRLHQEADDHAGLELAFLAHLAQTSLAAQTSGETARLPALLGAQRAFLAEHAKRWMPRWCAQVADKARTSFYQGASRLTAGVLTELETLVSAQPQVKAW